MLKLKYLIFITTVIAGVHSAPYVNKCKSDDSKCAKEASALLIPMFSDGIPELGIEPVDPLLIKKSDASSPNLKLILTDYTVSGLKNCIPKKVKYDKSKSKILLKLLCTAQLEGTYDMKGQLLILPLEGNGPIHVTLNKAEISIELDLDEIEKDAPYVNKCKSDDSKCAKEASALLIPMFGDGIPELGIEPVDPLLIKKSDASSPNLKLILTDYTVSGLKNCIPKKVKYDKSKSKILLKLLCTAQLEGTYDMKGQLLILPLEGNGPIHVTLNKAEISIELDLDEIEKDGVKYWNIKDHKFSYVLKDKSIKVFEICNIMYKLKYLVFITTCFAGVYSASFVNKCKSGDSKCVKESAAILIPRFGDGIPELGIEPVDPLFIKMSDASSPNLKLILTDYTLSGLKNKAEISVEADLNEIEKDGVKYWNIKDYKQGYELKDKSVVVFDNLFGGNDVLDKKCLKESAQAILPTFALGMPEYKMHSLDPLMIDKVDADNPNLKFKLTNLKISGLKDCVVKKHDADKSKIFLNLLCNVGIEGHYDMKGQIIILPMEGNGKIEADITKAAEDVMKESGNDVIQEVGPPVIKSIASKVVECAQRFFHAVPFNDLVLQ
ncbi:unnamed protein product [Leptidea sinapis]|uniref:Uncharacterized protein n=1 Tax=Leptidea sinapis TaxID=189913 RepID=A0A5E4QY15_9NEOP|nr:unnamed protein product [Leptidea sinapis]